MTLSFGVTREVWYAALDAPDTKYSFLIRDDAFSKSGAIFGRTVRLGEPLNTGPGSGWRQLSWEGGNGQHDFSDEAMFEEGSADVWSKTGRIRMWPGWGHFLKSNTRTFDSYSMGTGNVGPAIGNTKLYLGERCVFDTSGGPSNGFKAYKYDPDTNVVTTLPTTPSTLGTKGYTAICPATDDQSSSAFLYFGTGGGLWIYNETGNTWAQDTGQTYQINYDSLKPFRDALYYLSGTSLVKRTPAAGGLGILGTHTIVKTHKSAYALQGLAVWNNRLWYGLNYMGNKCMLASSDGVTANTIVEFPEEFFAMRMVAHYGALYIFGAKPQSTAGSNTAPAAISVVWKYTGSSLTKLWESNDEDLNGSTDRHPHIPGGCTTFGPLLVWGTSGYRNSVTPRAGLTMYDAEKDALFEGPHLPWDPTNTKGLAITNCHAWDNTLAISYYDLNAYPAGGPSRAQGVAHLRLPRYIRDKQKLQSATFGGRSVEVSEPERMEFVKSSAYRGDRSVAAEIKTWLTGKMTVRVPTNTLIRVYAETNEYENHLVATITPTADTGWRQVTFALKNQGEYSLFSSLEDGKVADVLDAANDGAYLQSSIFRYRIELVNNGGGTQTIATPEVDAIEVAWTVAPAKRLKYHLRHVHQDGQLRLTGAANPLTTAQAQADALEDLWSAALPFRMWGPYASAVDPTTLNSGNCIEVVPQVESYTVQQYRLGSDDDEVAQETGITLIENVL